jgi:hypothetical protein
VVADEIPLRQKAVLNFMGIVVINSTVAARREMWTDGQMSPIHYWGYVPGPADTLLCTRQNRYEIVFRHRVCKGTDPRVLLQTIWRLKRGALGVYVVTQPDLMRAIPLVKRLFPSKPVATWIWTPHEARANARYLKASDHVFSLTNTGVDELRKLGMNGRCSLGLWGCDPGFYQLEEKSRPVIAHDLLFFGLVCRDVELVRRLAGTGEFTIATAKRSVAAIGAGLGLKEFEADSKAGLLRAIHSAHASLVPLLPGDPEPTGFTNVIESLLCGTSVVIADCSIIPEEALGLPGVHRFRAGDLDSFRSVCRQAVIENQQPGRRDEIRRRAAAVLDGSKLNAEIRRVMGLPEGKTAP